MKHSHRAVPLHVYVKKKLIGVEDVPDILSGALVELHFELRHFEIATKDLHSFNGNIEQIMVLQPSQPRPATVFKRHTAEEGPIRMNPALAAIQDEAQSGKLRHHIFTPLRQTPSLYLNLIVPFPLFR